MKIWEFTTSMQNVKPLKSIWTEHRGNIFCADLNPYNDDFIVSTAADGAIKTTNLDNRHQGSELYRSTDLIHMFHFDIDQPNGMTENS